MVADGGGSMRRIGLGRLLDLYSCSNQALKTQAAGVGLGMVADGGGSMRRIGLGRLLDLYSCGNQALKTQGHKGMDADPK